MVMVIFMTTNHYDDDDGYDWGVTKQNVTNVIFPDIYLYFAILSKLVWCLFIIGLVPGCPSVLCMRDTRGPNKGNMEASHLYLENIKILPHCNTLP